MILAPAFMATGLIILWFEGWMTFGLPALLVALIVFSIGIRAVVVRRRRNAA